MEKRITTLAAALTLFAGSHLLAQNGKTATLHVNNVKVSINSNGSFFWDGLSGQFIAPYEAGQPEISTMRSVGVWLAGLDEGGNLKGAVQLYNENGKADFQPGIINADTGEPENVLTGIYRVTADDIQQHLADFADNGTIDSPNPNVFGWPATGNPHFSVFHNGEQLPVTAQGLAPFFDQNSDGIYSPLSGDYPILSIRGCEGESPIYADEMLWFVFNDNKEHTESGMLPAIMEIQCLVFAFNCQESPLGNTVFTYYKMINRATEAINSTYFGMFADFDIGNPEDDFFGSDADRSMMFGYNGDDSDEGAYGENPPAMAVDLLRGPLNEFAMESSLSHVMPVETLQPSQPAQFYNLLSGAYPDGTTAPNNGFFYDGNPNIPGEWSEIEEANMPGDRRVVGSYGPFKLFPGAVNELITAFTFYQEPDKSNLENVAAMYVQSDQVQALFDNCFDASVNVPCTPIATAVFEKPALKLSFSPNPVSDYVTIQMAGLENVSLIGLDGRVVFDKKLDVAQQSHSLNFGNLAPGFYVLKGTTIKGETATGKVIVL